MGAGAGELRELEIFTRQTDRDGIVVAVRDLRLGLDAANPERVFENFYTTKPARLGMGLSICRSIIEAHGGRLWASANTPRGPTFRFTLPVQGQGPPNNEESAERVVTRRGSRRANTVSTLLQ